MHGGKDILKFCHDGLQCATVAGMFSFFNALTTSSVFSFLTVAGSVPSLIALYGSTSKHAQVHEEYPDTVRFILTGKAVRFLAGKRCEQPLSFCHFFFRFSAPGDAL